MTLPILYSFRRCPYAMRARLAIVYSGIEVELREILLKNKPDAMLQASSKGTVPVLVLENGDAIDADGSHVIDANHIIDESLAVMLWALLQSDNTEINLSFTTQKSQHELILENDKQFKPWLDRYKYHVGYPENSQQYYREQCEVFLQKLDRQIGDQQNLFGERPSLADIAIFPFVRQFAFVDKAWLDQSPYPSLISWLERWLETEAFKTAMQKFPEWRSGETDIKFPNRQ